jgi:hypothetical protein
MDAKDLIAHLDRLGGPHLNPPQPRVPHLRDSFIVAKVGHSRKARTAFFRRETIPFART